jgi:hypothetical protein
MMEIPGSPQSLSLYPLAGQFVSHLVTKFGLDTFVRFYRSMAGNVTADVIAARFMAAYGVTLDEVWPQAMAAYRPICLSLWECSQPGLALDGTTISIGMTCGLDLVPRTVRLAEPDNLFGWFRNAGSNPSIAGVCGDSSTTGVLSLWPGGSFHLTAAARQIRARARWSPMDPNRDRRWTGRVAGRCRRAAHGS